MPIQKGDIPTGRLVALQVGGADDRAAGSSDIRVASPTEPVQENGGVGDDLRGGTALARPGRGGLGDRAKIREHGVGA